MKPDIENFLKLLELSGLIEKQDFATLEKYPTVEDIFDALEVTNISNIKLTEVYAKFRDLPFVQINSIDEKALEIIDQELAKRFGFIPFYRDSVHKILQVAITNPRKFLILNREKLSELGKKIGYKIEVMMASKIQIEKALMSQQPQDQQLDGQDLSRSEVKLENLKAFSSSDMISELVDGIISFSLAGHASDVHIEPFEKTIRIRIRVDGEMEEIISLPSTQLTAIISRVKVLSGMKIEEERIPQDGRFDVNFKNQSVDIRVSTLPTIFGEKITFRLLPKTGGLAELKSLGIEGVGYDRLIKAISQPYGVIIATGPTGSGKTTTIYSILNELNKPEVDIITLEETVEYELPRVNQVKLQSHLGFGYAEGIKSVLKQDPNIIYVGEITDKETAELVVRAALTGRMVLTTLHTNDAVEALPRLLNLGVEPFLLSSAVKIIVAQRLVRRLCQKCKEQVQLSQAALMSVKNELDSLNTGLPYTFCQSKGCAECKNGFSGRMAIFEVLPIDQNIEELIINKKSDKELLAGAKAGGFITMRQDGLIKALKGLTSVDEVFRATTRMEN